MKLGLNVPNFGPGTDPESLAGWLRFAENSGFDLAMMSDHVAVTPDVAELYPPPFYDPFTALAWLAGLTERIELGTTVTVLPYRNPLLVARVVASIDQFSGGRFVFGVGVGWSRREYAALGVPFERRGAITDDYLAAITALWTSNIASHDGTHVSFHEVHTEPRGARRPHPPIWVGGTSPAAIRRTVRFGDAWHPNNAEIGWLRESGLSALQAAADQAGRPRPAFNPRMRLNVTDTALDDSRRAGEARSLRCSMISKTWSTSAPGTSFWTPTQTTRRSAGRLRRTGRCSKPSPQHCREIERLGKPAPAGR